MIFDLDQYYTPERVAKQALERVDLAGDPTSCADSTCGTGRLLDAASHIFGDVECLGIDRDGTTIRELRRRRPNWTLGIGDILSKQSQSFSRLIPARTDLLLMNPPFSHRSTKHVHINYDGLSLKGSVAMAYILRSLELIKPRYGAALIVPESLLYSETDALARDALTRKYKLRKVADLKNCTFQGARAHACIVQASPGSTLPTTKECRKLKDATSIQLSRGCLPVHAAKRVHKGIPYLHSTDIKTITQEQNLSALTQTSAEGARTVSGWVVLVPRVGMPDTTSVRAVLLAKPVRLSDCVIAIRCTSMKTADRVARAIRNESKSFRELYKGTGARYVTMTRLKEWLETRGFVDVGDAMRDLG